jgi:hypothetical protein
VVLLKYVFRDIHDLVVVNVGEGQSGVAEVVFDVELIAPGGAIGRDAPFGVVDGIHGERVYAYSNHVVSELISKPTGLTPSIDHTTSLSL